MSLISLLGKCLRFKLTSLKSTELKKQQETVLRISSHISAWYSTAVKQTEGWTQHVPVLVIYNRSIAHWKSTVFVKVMDVFLSFFHIKRENSHGLTLNCLACVGWQTPMCLKIQPCLRHQFQYSVCLYQKVITQSENVSATILIINSSFSFSKTKSQTFCF